MATKFMLITSLLFIGATLNSQMSIIPSDYQMIYFESFDNLSSTNRWEMSDSDVWEVDYLNSDGHLNLSSSSKYVPRVRSPFNVAVLKNLLVGDFVFEAQLAQTGKEYAHRDLCLFFGMKDASNFYYVHIASVTDDHANNIFIVNDEPRTKISTQTTTGTDWGDSGTWHRVRIHRNVSTGSIAVYFDDFATPIMTATDIHFDVGYVGLGSFDDTGKFDNIKIWAPEVYTESGLSLFSSASRK